MALALHRVLVILITLGFQKHLKVQSSLCHVLWVRCSISCGKGDTFSYEFKMHSKYLKNSMLHYINDSDLNENSVYAQFSEGV